MEGDPGADPFARKDAPKEDAMMTEEGLKKIFNQFDTDKSGSIDVGELNDAMRLLGVKCSLNSAKKILTVIDTDQNGTIEWEEFHAFFAKVQSPEEIKQLLSTVNQKFLDYKMMVQNDPNFGKLFYMPPMLSSIQKFACHNDNVEAVCWLKGNMFASCSLDGAIMVWDAKSEGDPTASKSVKKVKPIKTLENPTEKGYFCMNADKDGKFVVVGSGATSDNVAMWDLEKEEIVTTYSGHTSACYCLSLAADNNRFATGGKNGLVVTYDRSTPEPMCVLEAHSNTVYGVSYREDCNTVCSCSGDGTIKIWDLKAVKSAKAVALIDDAAASGVVYDCLWRKEHEIISCGDDFCIKRWDIRAIGQGSITNYFGHTSTVRSVRLSPDDKFLISSTDDGSIRLWLADEVGIINDSQVETNNKIESKEREVEKMTEKMEKGDCDPITVKLLQGQLEGLRTEKKYLDAVRKERDSMSCVQARVCLEGHNLSVTNMAWQDCEDSPGNAMILSASQDQTIRVFDIDREALEHFELWSKEEDEPEARRPSKDTYRRPSVLGS